ncbi:L,D-transpeptidase family protein [Miniphocaeibacter massiliensis]|uniref:L,D-transpeptidase family protein n=1 Tax=Miniphocaeibacter massiliensis TaxID=2041841 RepID=UPI000C08C415|nr:L,D-transpeptidase family protein [Miniphocaeibacter massiliensis]
MDGRKKPILKIFFIVFAFLILVYAFGVIYFSKYMYPNTYVNNVDMSFSSISLASEKVKIEDIEIIDRDGKTYKLSPEKLNFKAEYTETMDIEQNSFLWPLEIFSAPDYENKLNKTIDSKQLKNWINNSELLKNTVEPRDAEIKKNEKGYYIEKEVMGNKLDVDKLYNSIETAYMNSTNQIVLEDEYINPTVFAKDLEVRKEHLSNLFNLNLAIKLHDGKEVLIDNLEQFIDGNTFEIQREKVQSYVTNLKSEYDNINITRKFKTSYGTEVEVPPGNFGTQINLEKTTDAIFSAISNGNGGTVDLIYTTTAINNGEIGNTYVEISIENQNMWFYKDGKLIVETPVVTGKPKRYSTPKGVWNVWIKETDRYLRGNNADGSKYKSWVNYWMQIDGTGVGIHDASWRSSFGGSIYSYGGSHGCINTPFKNAKMIYDNIEKGTPVIVY